MKNKIIPIILCVLLLSTSACKKKQHQVYDQVCEYQQDPVGIDVAKPRLSWKMNSNEEEDFQTAYELVVFQGRETIWSSGKVESARSVHISYEGPVLPSMKRVYWKVRTWNKLGKVSSWSHPAYWETGLLEEKDWKADWITLPDNLKIQKHRPVYFRRDFECPKKIEYARIYVSALGIYELFLNGEKVGRDYFTPGWTSYKKRIQYQTYDVTEMLQEKNAIGAVVAEGWYSGRLAWENRENLFGDKNALITQLFIQYTDGSSEIIASDNSWECAYGPILKAGIYDGESYDATLEQDGWQLNGFSDQSWGLVSVLQHPKSVLMAQIGNPVKAIEEIKPVAQIETPKGETVFDMGQNMVGSVRLKVNGKKGDRVILNFAEVLDKEGNFYTTNLRSAKNTDVFILKGTGEELFFPHFTFHGFRYVKVEGCSGLDMNSITGIVMHSEMEQTSNFTCSEPLINQLQSNILWGQKGNFLDIPTDCPQRDERLGWTGDAQVFAPTAAFNFDVASFFTRWLGDLKLDQLDNGLVPSVIPDVLNGSGGSAAWADAAVVIPYQMYLAYGDKQILREQYASMKKWVSYMKSRAGEDYLWTGDYHYSDWLDFASATAGKGTVKINRDLIANAYFFYSTSLTAKIASLLGENEDKIYLDELAQSVKAAFNKTYVKEDGQLKSPTQTAYCLALHFNLLPKPLIEKAAKHLADDVKNYGHLTTGFVGTPLLCKTLTDFGYANLAFMLLNRKEYPSWLYPVTQGATTIWERWDGQKPDGTFQDVGMNSFNHYAYGAIGEWLYRYVAGINIDPRHPGYKHILLAPHPGGGLTNASAEIESMYGKVLSAWEVNNGTMNYTIKIPANTSATVTLPQVAGGIQLNRKSLKASGVSDLKSSGDEVSFDVGSGAYTINYQIY